MTTSKIDESDMKKKAKDKLKITSDPMEKLRLKLLTRGCGGIKGFGRMFRIMDDDGNRKLSESEFRKGLHDYGLDLDDNDAKQPGMSKSRQQIVLKAYKKLDKTGDGVITVNDLKGVYNVNKHPKFVSGEMTHDQLFQSFLETFEVGGHLDGKVTKDEFLNYYSGVSASIDNDLYFDLMMRNAWKL